MEPAKDDFELKITIKPLKEAGPDLSIRWENSPEIMQEWDHSDQIWTKIRNAIHGLLAEIGPPPEQGYEVIFSCKNYDHLIEPITQEEYRRRSNA